jgi:predicted GNAT family acetyltransferase
MAAAALLIQHEAAAQRFVARLTAAGPELGELTYVLAKAQMDLQHTFVAPSGRGMGVGARLAEAACEHARSQRYSLLASCSFLSDKFFVANCPPGWSYDAKSKCAILQ